MNKKIYLLFGLMFLFSFAFVSAESLGIFKQNQEIQITNYCVSADCTYANLNSITFPNGTKNYINDEMTQIENEFNYSYTPLEIGTYSFITCSNPTGVLVCEKDSFEVTEEVSSGLFSFDLDNKGNILIYIVLFVLSILAFIIKKIEISSLLMIILGFFMLASKVNTLASVVVISIGVIIAFTGGDE